MPLTPYTHSGIEFLLDPDNTFFIEEDPERAALQGVKTVEFISTIKSKNYFVEAKSSVALKEICDSRNALHDGVPFPPGWRIQTYFKQFTQDILQKFLDSFSYTKACLDGWHGADKKEEIKEKLKKLDKENLLFVLVVNTDDLQSLIPILDELKRISKHFLNSWNIPEKNLKVVSYSNASLIDLQCHRPLR